VALLAGKRIAGVWEWRRSAAADEPRVPPDMIGAQMRAQFVDPNKSAHLTIALSASK
jgi:hypothetical protein